MEPTSQPIQLAPMCDEDTNPGFLETSEHNDGFLLSFDGEQHWTELNQDQIKYLVKRSGEPASELEGFGYTPQFLLGTQAAKELRDRLDNFLAFKLNGL